MGTSTVHFDVKSQRQMVRIEVIRQNHINTNKFRGSSQDQVQYISSSIQNSCWDKITQHQKVIIKHRPKSKVRASDEVGNIERQLSNAWKIEVPDQVEGGKSRGINSFQTLSKDERVLHFGIWWSVTNTK